MGWVFGQAEGVKVWSLVVVRMAIELKYRNTLRIYTDVHTLISKAGEKK